MQTTQPVLGLGNLPPEIVVAITDYLQLSETRPLVQLNKHFYAITAPILYCTIHVLKATSCNTAGWVEILSSRPHIAYMIRTIILNEFDPREFRRLLAFELHALDKIILQHQGPIRTDITREEKLKLNKHLTPKPNLSSFAFTIQQTPETDLDRSPEVYKMVAEDNVFFCHPSLRRLRLHRVDFTSLEESPIENFTYPKLEHLIIEMCDYTADAMERLLLPASALQKLRIYHYWSTPLPITRYPALLYPLRESLRSLELVWRHLQLALPESGVDYSNFTALKHFQVNAEHCLGRYEASTNLKQLLASRLPPNLLILFFDSLVPIASRMHLDLALPVEKPQDALLRAVLQNCTEILPDLRRLYFTHFEGRMHAADLIRLGKSKSVLFSGLYATDIVELPNDWEYHDFSPGPSNAGSIHGGEPVDLTQLSIGPVEHAGVELSGDAIPSLEEDTELS